MTEPVYKPPAPLTPLPPQCPPGMVELNGRCIREIDSNDGQLAPKPQPYLNATEGLSGIGRAMRDKYETEAMRMRPIDDGELPRERFQNPPPEETYKKGGRVKRKSDMGHMSHADHVKKHYAVGGFIHHSDHAKKLCGGGYMKGKK